MDIHLNTVNPNTGKERSVESTEVQRAKIEREIALEKSKMRKDELKEEKLKKEKRDIARNFVMSEADMKELLLMMGSRGNPQTIERLVELVKREKELLAKKLG